MATILDLFKSQKADLYGKSGLAYIESKGLVNPPRAAALAITTPTTISGLIGSQVAGVVKGTALRPSDTIFLKKLPIPPISAIPVGPKDIVQPNVNYYVKTEPDPSSVIARVKQGASSPAGVASNIAVQALKNPIRTGKAIRDLSNKLKNTITEPLTTEYGDERGGNKFVFSKYEPQYTKNESGLGYKQTNINPRDNKTSFDSKTMKSVLDSRIYDLISNPDNAESINNFITLNEEINTPYVLIQDYKNTSKQILLPGTISGIGEDFTPEWTPYKYLGSPFNVYKYVGIERTFKFDLKLYFEDKKTKDSMRRKLDQVKALTMPDSRPSVISYPNSGHSPITFTPRLIRLTINGFYENLLCFVSSLSINIEDNIPWVTTSQDDSPQQVTLGSSKVKPYPSVFNVSFGITILNNPKLVQSDTNKDDMIFEYGNDENATSKFFTGTSIT